MNAETDKIEKTVMDLTLRVSRLETNSAVDEVRYDSIKSRLDKIDGHMGKLVWLIILAIGSGFMTFVLKGGLNVIQ